MNIISQFFNLLTAPFRFLFQLPSYFFSAPQRLMGMSLPARVAILIALFLFLCTISALVVVLVTEDAADFRMWFLRWELILVVALLFIIPTVVYYGVKLWLEGDLSRFPDIDEAWNEGLAALAERGVDLNDLPIFLVLGAAGDRSAETLLKATGFKFDVQNIPRGTSPLHWYADENGIYILCMNSCLGKVAESFAPSGTVAASHGDAIRGTLESPAAIRGTAVGGGARDTAAPRNIGDSNLGDDFGAAAVRGTLVAGAATPSQPGSPATPAGAATSFSRREMDEQAERLKYVCQLVRRARQPVCPINGVLTLLPMQIVSNVMAAREIPTAVRKDLDSIREATKLLCPVTALVTGMETENGFTELVRRVGASRAKANRFGKGFDVWGRPSGENMDALSAHACGAFEDWVYTLFREKDGLNKPGNAKLYSLLCNIRTNLRSRLRNILLHGYSCDSTETPAGDAILFGGCYFAATGDSEDRQAFVRSVFEKMLDAEEELEWTAGAIAEDNRYHGLARLGMTWCGLLTIGLIAMYVYRFVVLK